MPAIPADQVAVYCAASRLAALRVALGRACSATGVAARVEAFGSGALFRRLYAERERPRADLLVGRGPFLAQLAAQEGLLEAYQPPAWDASQLPLPATSVRDPGWRWVALDLAPFATEGAPSVASFAELEPGGAVERLAVVDPARSEVGVFALLATLDRARKDPSGGGWDWWAAWLARGLALEEDEGQAREAVRNGLATHALGLASPGWSTARPLAGLAPIPNAAGLVAGAPHLDAARRLFDWLAGPAGAEAVARAGLLSPWHADSNGLAAATASAAPLDVGWTFAQYNVARREWNRRLQLGAG